MSQEEYSIRAMKQEVEGDILTKPNVVGVGVGFKETRGFITDEVSIMVLVREKKPPSALSRKQMVPDRVDGILTDVVEVGVLRSQQSRTDRWRPAPGGVSIAHYKVTAGTLGAVVRDANTGQRLILSNNHVLASSNEASPGDVILQPGPVDGGDDPADIIGYLERFVPIQFNVEPGTCSVADGYALVGNLVARMLGSSHRLATFNTHAEATNTVDAAVARPIEDGVVLDEILEVGSVMGVTEAMLGMSVVKSGRTTGFTSGSVRVLDTTVEVSYGVGQTVRFVNQVVTTPMSQGGDSGSLVLEAGSQRAVGLLFAGSSQATIFNPIQAVMEELEITL